ncbi:MAG TPA: vWA domain-containing protein, partial [Polyangia bacterium]|nr:vWA domain-containing protein [Polyangia bacterium]
RVTLAGQGVLRVTVTHTFEPREPSHPVALYRGFDLPGDAVVTSLALDSDGAWREARLRRSRGVEAGGAAAAPAVARRARPWAALEWLTGHQAQIETAMFRVRGRFAVRYTLLSRGEPWSGGHRWLFCPDEGEQLAPQVVAAARPAAGGTKLEVRPSVDADGCREVVATEPPPAALAPRYASYRLGPAAWLWRIELRVPVSLVPVPPPPEPGPVVFVLDGSRSQGPNGGLESQLAIVRAFLANAPKADIELLVVGRSAERVFGRFVPASDLERTLPAEFVRRPLGNGSFLDRGAAMAAQIVADSGRPGRVVLMTDGELRSAFDRTAVIASLRRAPAGTVVHLVYPGNWTKAEVTPWAGDALIEIAADFGGAAYQFTVGKPGPSSAEGLAALAHRLVWPDRVESIELHDLSNREQPEWPPFPSFPFSGAAGEVEAGTEQVWSAISPTAPPRRLALTGQIWSRKVDLPLRPDVSLSRELPRLATADDQTMNCSTTAHHERVALAGGFLAPGLVFWIPGTGDGFATGVGGIDPDCSAGFSGGGTGPRPPERQELPRALVEAMPRCGLAARPDGAVVAKIETQRNEILDVGIEAPGGVDSGRRRCIEEALWTSLLPEAFNSGRWGRELYVLRLTALPGGH